MIRYLNYKISQLRKLKAFTLIETLVSLSLISIISTIAIMTINSVLNPGREYVKLEAYMSLKSIEIELVKSNQPIELIIEDEEEKHGFTYEYEVIKHNDSETYMVDLFIMKDSKTLYNEKIIVKDR